MFVCMSFVRILIVPEGCKHKDGRDEGNQRGSVTCSVHLPESGIIWCLEHMDKNKEKRKSYKIISKEIFHLSFIKRFYNEMASLFILICALQHIMLSLRFILLQTSSNLNVTICFCEQFTQKCILLVVAQRCFDLMQLP